MYALQFYVRITRLIEFMNFQKVMDTMKALTGSQQNTIIQFTFNSAQIRYPINKFDKNKKKIPIKENKS